MRRGKVGAGARPDTGNRSPDPVRYVGVDAGASRSTALVADQRLDVVARASGPGGALALDTVGRAAAGILATVRTALAEAASKHVRALVVGAAGAGGERERTALEGALVRAGIAHDVRVVTDIEIALVAAFGEEPGILLLSGTGSGACARLPGGVIERIGGHGWQFGDEGSGYALARAALAAVAQAEDGRGPATALTIRLARAANVAATAEALLRWARGEPRAGVAGLASIVQDVAASGDAVARALLEHAAHDLVAHVRALLKQFDGDGAVSVALAGGVLHGTPPARQAVVRLLAEELPRVRVSLAPVEPARGALLLASRLA